MRSSACSSRVAKISSIAALSPSGSRAWMTSGSSELPGHLDLAEEGAPLVLGRGGVAVEVEAGLADRPHLRVGAELEQRRLRPVVESLGGVGMAADAGEDRLVGLGLGDHLRVGRLVEADVQHPLDPGRGGRLEQLDGRLLAEEEVRVGVDHAAGVSIFGKSGWIRSTVWPPPREPSSARARPSSPSVASSVSAVSGRKGTSIRVTTRRPSIRL